MKKGGSVYILTNKNNAVLYIGVTNDLIRRILEHKEKLYRTSFSAKYNLGKLVYFENFHNIEEAISREKQLKAGSRIKKEKLIHGMNPEWLDLYGGLLED
jgi:putative endonuclease